jgi:cysteine desulfurase / selenocysteine lyase
LDYKAFEEMLSSKVKFVAVTAVSNALGVVNDVAKVTKMAHAVGAKVLVDAAQLVTHKKIDVQEIDCDFLVFSAHKLYGPTGVGILHGKKKLLEAIPPMSYGGGIVESVTLEKTTFTGLPNKHEGGTSNIAGVIGLGAAIDFVNELDIENIHAHAQSLNDYAINQLKSLDGINVLGEPEERAALISLTVKNAHPHDVSTFLGEKGIGIRAGHHCAQPLMNRLQVPATSRLSFGVYNTIEEVDQAIAALIEVRDFFA